MSSIVNEDSVAPAAGEDLLGQLLEKKVMLRNSGPTQEKTLLDIVGPQAMYTDVTIENGNDNMNRDDGIKLLLDRALENPVFSTDSGQDLPKESKESKEVAMTTTEQFNPFFGAPSDGESEGEMNQNHEGEEQQNKWKNEQTEVKGVKMIFEETNLNQETPQLEVANPFFAAEEDELEDEEEEENPYTGLEILIQGLLGKSYEWSKVIRAGGGQIVYSINPKKKSQRIW
jgi:hypothetical protein